MQKVKRSVWKCGHCVLSLYFNAKTVYFVTIFVIFLTRLYSQILKAPDRNVGVLFLPSGQNSASASTSVDHLHRRLQSRRRAARNSHHRGASSGSLLSPSDWCYTLWLTSQCIIGSLFAFFKPPAPRQSSDTVGNRKFRSLAPAGDVLSRRENCVRACMRVWSTCHLRRNWADSTSKLPFKRAWE